MTSDTRNPTSATVAMKSASLLMVSRKPASSRYTTSPGNGLTTLAILSSVSLQ